MKNYFKNIKRNHLNIFFISLGALSLFFISSSIYNGEINDYKKGKIRDLELAYDIITNSIKKTSEIIFNEAINKPSVWKILEKANSKDSIIVKKAHQELLQKTLPIYQRIQQRKINIFHFHLLNNESFLRLHEPFRFGDNLSSYRYSVKMTNLEKKSHFGFEKGRVQNGFRHVFPIITSENEHLGSVEIAEIDQVLNKKIKEKVRRDLINYMPVSVYTEYKSNYHTISFLPIANIKGEKVAFLVSYEKDNSIKKLKRIYHFVIIILAVFFIWIIRLIFKIEKNNEKLKISQRKLEKSKNNYRTLANNVSEIIYRCKNDLQWTMIFISDGVQNITGYPSNDFINNKIRSYSDTIHPDDREEVKSIIDENIKNRTQFQIEYRIITKENSIKWVFEKGKGVFDTNGELLWIDGIIFDITARKQESEKAWRDSNEKFDLLANNFKDVICLHQVDGKYIYISPSCKHILGYSPEELLGTNPMKLVHPDDLVDLGKKYKKKLKGEDNLTTYRIRKKTGEYIWFESVNQMIKDEDGNVSKFVSSSRDVTKRKIAEEKLKESEMKYRLMIESSSDAIVIRQDGKFIFVNEALAQMLDYSKEELLTIDNRDIFQDKTLENIEKRINENIDFQSEINNFETVLHKKNGSQIVVEISERIIDFNGKKSQFAIIHDITQQKEIMKELLKGAEQTKGLGGFIPICAGCSKIRDDEKEDKPWLKPADYISERLPDIKFSHTMCPDCVKKWYPDFKGKI